jgi:hypothetical protein
MAGTPKSTLRVLVLLCLFGSLLLSLGSTPAFGRSLTTHVLEKAEYANEGVEYPNYFEINSIAVDEHTGYVYVAGRDPVITKFKPDGTLGSWSAPQLHGASSILATPFPPPNNNPGTGAKVAVDNTNGPHQGRIYLISRTPFDEIHAFEPDGIEVTEANSGEHWPLTNHDVTPAQFGPFNMTVDEDGNIWENEENGFFFWREFKPDGERGTVVRSEVAGEGGWGLDSNNNVYLGQYGGTTKYSINAERLFGVAPYSGDIAVDRSDDNVYLVGNSGENSEYINQYEPNGNFVGRISVGTSGYNARIAVDGSTNRIYWGSGGQLRLFAPGPARVIPDISTDSASNFEATSVTVHGTVNPDSVDTTSCQFLYGPSEFSTNTPVPCEQGEVLSGSGDQEVSADLTGLSQGQTYYYRLRVSNPNQQVVGAPKAFVPSATPSSKGSYITGVHADSAFVHASVDPGGAPTKFHVEYGPEPCSSNPCGSSEEAQVGSEVGFKAVLMRLEGLEENTTYYYRISASNQSGTYTASEENTFTTFHRVKFGDTCPNAHVRQQTGSALLLDCRAYELVSAGNAGGYDVESDLSPGQEPLGGYPAADGRALYAIHSGAIPGVGDPANLGPDPYLGTRGSSGWSTEYVGLPSENPNASGPFASSLLEADSGLTTFAFGGPKICAPCFADGSTNIPLRLPNGELVEGMEGSESGPAEPSGVVTKRFSSDGSSFVFGTTAKLEPGANSNGTDTTIYERNLEAESTEVVSTLPDGSAIQDGSDVAELGISSDGSRVVVGELISTDADGNNYYHLYMHLAGSADSVDLTPGTTSGVLFDGMSANGAMVYFRTSDPLVTASNQDTDTSADIFRADVSGSTATLTRITSGAGAGNSDACNPPGGWNSVSGGENCDAVAIAGGGGVASESGTIYFLSPEVLDTSGSTQPEQDQANLYSDAPGAPPHFVATVDTSTGKPPPPPPTHQLVNNSFESGYEVPGTMAVDQTDGDLYVGDASTSEVSRWKSNGEPDEFAAAGSNTLHVPYYSATEGQIAVDSSSSPFQHDLFVTTNSSEVFVYNQIGQKVGALSGFNEACGVAVDQSSGDVYVGSWPSTVFRFRPKSTLVEPVTNGSYEPAEKIQVQNGELCNIDVSAEGHLYAWPYYGGALRQFDTSVFEAGGEPTVPGKSFAGGIEISNMQTDPLTGFVYAISEGTVKSYQPDGTELESFGSVGGGLGIGVDAANERIYIGKYFFPKILEFGPSGGHYEVIENPFVRHGVTRAGVHSYEDFQVTPDGRFAVFPTKLRLKSSYDNGGHSELYRYDDANEELVCVSCNPSNAIAEANASLAARGLSLTDDGTVFFNTGDAITGRDLDGKVDVYEYGKDANGGESAELLSTGLSPFNSSLLGATADGLDVFFFTRETLVPQDENGSLVKLYDARRLGGFEFFPEKVACKASDECHGPGTVQPPPPGIGTLEGNTGNHTGASSNKPSCRRGYARKHGRCVKRNHGKKRAHRHAHRKADPTTRVHG